MAAMMATERLWRMTRPGPEPVARNAVSWRPMPVLRRPVEPAAYNGLKSDIVRFRKVPNSEVNASFNHLVGAGEQGRWNVDAERFGGLEVHHQFELGWLTQLAHLFPQL